MVLMPALYQYRQDLVGISFSAPESFLKRYRETEPALRPVTAKGVPFPDTAFF
jgi:hypothetical protein